MTDETILDLYRYEVDSPRDVHYTHWFPDGKKETSTAEFFRRTAALAAALEDIGVGKGDRVMLLSDNRPEWHVADLAVLDIGAVDVPVYTTLTPRQIRYQVNDSEASVAVAENPEHMKKFLDVMDDCPGLRHLVQIEGECDTGVRSLDALVKEFSSSRAEREFWKRAGSLGADDLASIVYTSGTTGDPKGVMLSHGNFTSNVAAAMKRVDLKRDSSDLALEYLPLSHVLERCVGYAYMKVAVDKAYCSAYHVADLVADIAPTVFVSVPRLYEKVHAKVMTQLEESPPGKRSFFEWALDKGTAVAERRLAGRDPGILLGLQYRIAERFVLSKVREGFGGRLRFSLSGGAPLARDLNMFFHALGLPIQEGYGLTETSPAITLNGNGPGENRPGSVGKPLDNLDVRLDDDGELLVKGPSVMKGYWNKPEQTAEVFTEDGYFRTGDIARMEGGFVHLTDRKKDLIVTAGGKNVAPAIVEERLLLSRFITSAVVIGDRKPYLTALLSPDLEHLERWAKAEGIEYKDNQDLINRPETRDLYEKDVDAANEDLAPFEQIKKFRILPLTLTVENGYLTPTMKVKRRIIARAYSELIDEMYEGAVAWPEASD